jgi:hypothetical protein
MERDRMLHLRNSLLMSIKIKLCRRPDFKGGVNS